MLEVRNIDVKYGDVQALWGVSLAVARGEVVALLGANGAGKSTTLNAIVGLLSPSAGDILLDGKSIKGRPTHKLLEDGVSLVPEGRGLFSSMTVEENLLVGAHLPRHFARVKENLARVYDIFPILKQRRRQLAGSLSGGQQQMLTISRALMSRPRLLILDEPSLGVAPLTIRQIYHVLTQLNAEGVTLLIVEQSIGLALNLCHRAYVLESGRIVAAGTAAELRQDVHIREAYLGAS